MAVEGSLFSLDFFLENSNILKLSKILCREIFVDKFYMNFLNSTFTDFEQLSLIVISYNFL